jgi:hypothetical protein
VAKAGTPNFPKGSPANAGGVQGGVQQAANAAVAKAAVFDPGAEILQMHHPKVKPLIEDLQTIRGSKVLTYFLSDGAAIGEDVIVYMYEHLLRMGHQAQIDLYLVSRGGATEVPWRIVTMIREFCDKFTVLLPYHAASAATHISLGADEIVMTEIAQLGPVDPSRTHPLLPADPFLPGAQRPMAISVQDLRHFIQFVEKEGSEGVNVRPEDPTAIYVELMRQVHPLVIGAMEQSYTMAKQLTKNMLRLHLDADKDAALIDKLADHLADDFKSHVYPISRQEAKDMGLPVTFADAGLRDAMWALWRYYATMMIQLDGDNPIHGKMTMLGTSYTDSEHGTAVGFATRDKQGAVVGGQWFAGWPNP